VCVCVCVCVCTFYPAYDKLKLQRHHKFKIITVAKVGGGIYCRSLDVCEYVCMYVPVWDGRGVQKSTNNAGKISIQMNIN